MIKEQLQPLLVAIYQPQQASKTIKSALLCPPHHFTDVSKVIPSGKGALQEVIDIALTRYACYLIAQNGDNRKQEIALPQKKRKQLKAASLSN